MSVKITESGKRTLKMLSNFDDINNDFIKALSQVVVGKPTKFLRPSPKQALILQNFDKNMERQRTFSPLKKKTIDNKKKRGENKILVATGKLKSEVKKKTRGFVKGSNYNMKAKVPNYGRMINNGVQGVTQRKFFNFKEDKFFEDLSNSILQRVIISHGVRTRR